MAAYERYPGKKARRPASSGTRAKGGGPQHIRRILEDFFRETGMETHVRENRAVLHWEEAAGTDLCRHTRAAYVEKGTLWVEVNNSVRMHSLQMQEAQLRERLNVAIRRTGSVTEPIGQIRFRLMTDP